MGIDFKAAKCPNCGASIDFGESERTQCPYCGVEVFIDRHELRIRILGKKVDFELYEKLKEQLLKRMESTGSMIISIAGLGELMAELDNKAFPYSKGEVKRFAEWVNRSEDIMVRTRDGYIGNRRMSFVVFQRRDVIPTFEIPDSSTVNSTERIKFASRIGLLGAIIGLIFGAYITSTFIGSILLFNTLSFIAFLMVEITCACLFYIIFLLVAWLKNAQQ